MKKTLAILIILISGCSSNSSYDQNKESDVVFNEIKEDTETQSISEQYRSAENEKVRYKQEVLHMDSVWLNNLIKFSTTQKDILTHLGDPDSITTPNFECGAYISGEEPWGDSVNIWHYTGAEIVTFKDRAELMTIRPQGSDWTLHHPKFIFTEQTTLNDLAEVFPNSVKNSYEWKDIRDGKTYNLVRLAPKPSWDDEWVLKFYQNKLIEIEYWTPC